MAVKERLIREGVAAGFRALLEGEEESVQKLFSAAVERAFFDWLESNREALLERIAAGVAGD